MKPIKNAVQRKKCSVNSIGVLATKSLIIDFFDLRYTTPFPLSRPRRLRGSPWVRELVVETHLGPQHLVLPLFVFKGSEVPGGLRKTGLPGCEIGNLVAFVEKKVLPSGVGAVALFPIIPNEDKDDAGACAFARDALVPKAIRSLRKAFPDLSIIADVALDPFTAHGHDGVLRGNVVDNDATLPMLAKLSCLYADAGANVVAPSDMMDGRVGCIRAALDQEGFQSVLILSYAVKYASCLYGPFRMAVAPSAVAGISKKTYQMDIRNAREALKEADLDAQEGADILMVKPAGTSLDIIQRISERTPLPVAAFQVSGEFLMIKAAAKQEFVNFDDVLIESLTVLRRAGASMIVTYGALEAAACLR